MKIIFDNIIYSWQRCGGISVVWNELLRRFILNENLDYTCLEYKNSSRNIFRKEIDIKDEHIKKVKTRMLTVSRYFSPSIDYDKPFIFHSSYYRTSNNKNAINVTTVHDFIYEKYSHGLKKFLHCWQKRRAIEAADAVVCISENTKRDLLNLYPKIDPQKLHVIYNGVSKCFHSLTETQSSDRDIVFVGTRTNYKNFDFLVNALSGTKYRLVICGAPLSAKEESFIRSKLNNDQYEVNVRISNEKLNIIYNSAHCLVYPSSYEGFGLPILEAQNAGCPVIAYNSSSIPEIIGNKFLMISSLDKKELLDKLDKLHDKNFREKIINEGFANASRFSWDKTAKLYMELYQSLFKNINKYEYTL